MGGGPGVGVPVEEEDADASLGTLLPLCISMPPAVGPVLFP